MKAYPNLLQHAFPVLLIAHYKTYRYGIVMVFLTRNKMIEVPILVRWKKLASVLLGVDVLYCGEIEGETRHYLKTGKGTLDVIRHADGEQNM